MSNIFKNKLVLSTKFAAVMAFAGVALTTNTKTANACSSEPYIGTICAVAFQFCPQGTVEALGQELPINQNQALFAILGVTYGGNGKTTFNVPDLRGRTPIGYGAATTTTPAVNLGQKLGEANTTLNSSNLPAHDHTATFTPVTAPVQVTIPEVPSTLAVNVAFKGTTTGTGASTLTAGSVLGSGGTGTAAAAIYYPASTSPQVDIGGMSAAVSGDAGVPAQQITVPKVTGGTVAVNPTGNSAAFNNYQPSLGLRMCIATQGIFPTRP